MSLMPHRLRTLVLTLAACAAAAPGWSAEAALTYTVSPRDTLIGLGRTLLVAPAAWPEVARLNRLPNPNLIYPGQRLQVPLHLLRSAQVPARVLSVDGQVRIDDRPAQAGDMLAPGQRLSTADSSSALLQLGDGSKVTLAPLSDTALVENRRFDLHPAGAAAGDDGMFATTMRLVRGSIEVLATKVLRAKPLEVTTPTAVIGVRGTQYRVHAADATSGTETLEGKVRADADAGGGVDVPAGFGAEVQAGRTPLAVPLAAAPDLSALPTRFERPLLRFALPGETLPLRVQVASDAAFEHLVRDERVAPGTDARIAGLPDGTWHVRVRRIAADGIEGYDAERSVVLKARPEPPAPLTPAARAKLPAGTVHLSWADNIEADHAVLQVARDAAFTQIVHEDDQVRSHGSALTLPDEGVYHWRLASVRAGGDRGPWGDPQRFVLRPLPSPPTGGLSADGKSLDVRWSAEPQERQQVELAHDPAFQQPIAQADLAAASWTLPRPPIVGKVYFRYRSAESDGFVTPWSSTLVIDLPRDWHFLWLLLPLAFGL